MDKVTVKINVAGLLPGLKKDSLVSVNVDAKGTPLDLFWFKRFRDMKTDNCITIIQSEIETKIKKKSGGK